MNIVMYHGLTLTQLRMNTTLAKEEASKKDGNVGNFGGAPHMER
jgi:hypothetical protein